MIPSGYKEDVVYSEIPINGAGDMSFTRASNGTRINSQGLVEVTPWNLFQQSENFPNAIWTKSTLTFNSTVTAPNGTSTAQNYSTAGAYSYVLQTITVSSGEYYTVSCYLKYTSGVGSISIGYTDAPSNNFIRVDANLINGTIGSVSYGGNGANGTATITSVGDGWYRVTVSGTLTIGNAGLIVSNLALGATTFSIWGAQLNIGSTAKPYFPTTDRLNVPRLTYQNGGGGCPSLLLEKQSTNDFIQSENLFTTHLVQNLTTSGNVDVATSPDGTQNADKFVPNSTSGVHGIANGSSLAITSGQTYSFSAFVKSDGGAFNLISLTFDSTTAWGATKNCIFNASTGASYSVPSSATMSSQNIGNGWYRITATLTASGSVSASLYQYRIYIADSSGNLSYAASSGNTAGIYVWGAQLEASSYPTSYIPTTSSSATRVADDYSRSLSSIASGTAFINITDNVAVGTPGTHLFGPFSITGASLGLYLSRPNNARLRLWTQASANVFQTTETNLKLAITWDGTNVNVYQNGVKVVTNYSYAITNVNNLFSSTYLESSATIAEIALFNSVLTDAECISLTS